MTTNNSGKIESVHCNRCLRNTDHTVIAERKIRESEELDENFVVSWEYTYTMLECCGCHDVTLRCSSWFSEIDGVEVEFYPPQVSRRMPKWSDAIPTEVSDLMNEVYTALHNNSSRLAIMGARSLVEMFMNDKVGDVGGFAQKLEALLKKGYLSLVQKEILFVALETGHAVTHRGFRPEKATVEQIMDIVENLLQHYALEEVVKDLRKVTPPRKKKA